MRKHKLCAGIVPVAIWCPRIVTPLFILRRKHNFGYHLITSTRFGKDIPEIAPAGLENILIPRLDSSIEKEIGAMFHKATNLQEQANMSENTAIKLIEENYEKMIID